LWDGQVFKLQVVDSTESAIKVRVLMSAADSGKSADLGAMLREKLIAYVRERYPTALPRSRQEPVSLPRAGEQLPDGGRPSAQVPPPN
jgi:hypothetical protein